MRNLNYYLAHVFMWLSLLLLSACGPDSSNTDPDDDALNNLQLTQSQAVIYFNKADSDYTDWGLYVWDDSGASFDISALPSTNTGTAWGSPLLNSGIDDQYGAYFIVTFDSPDWSGFNFILHKGDEKELGGGEIYFDRAIYQQDLYAFSGVSQVFANPTTELPVSVEGMSAHWLTSDIIVFNTPVSAQLFSSSNAALSLDEQAKQVIGGDAIPLSQTELSDSLKTQFPHLSTWQAWRVSQDVNVKLLMKNQLWVAGFNDNQEVIQVTLLQKAAVLDDLYATAAQAQIFGAQVSSGAVSFNVWAPTAQTLEVVLYSDAQGNNASTHALTFNEETGAWTGDVPAASVGSYYRYKLAVYHHTTDKIENLTVTDPYSLSLSASSTYSHVVDLNDESLKPNGWDTPNDYQVEKAEDIVIYETHIRDFSNSDTKGDATHNGKFLAYTESARDSVQHLKNLQAAGLTHIHLLPAFDVATINEDTTQSIDLNSSKAQLCVVNSNAQVCSDNTVNDDASIAEMLVACDTSTGCAQALMADIRPLDSFNWGYDPLHYTVPEGSYATNANGTTRILEFRQMVNALHSMGLSVVMDVVYNHTNSSGLWQNSVLDKVVPGYYHRLNPLSGLVETSSCCDNTASEHLMMEKLMIDSLLVWAKDYQIDSFRFDLMAHHTKANLVKALQTVQDNTDQFIYFYGEGWNFGEVINDSLFVQARQHNLNGTGIGSFSDRMRDAVRGGGPFDESQALRSQQGFANGLFTDPNEFNNASDDEKNNLYHLTDLIRLGMTGNLIDYILQISDDRLVKGNQMNYVGQVAGYTDDPQEVINYISKHDNQTLWDNNQYKLPTHTTLADRVRMQMLGLSAVLYAQGIPFLHMGVDLLRSKSFERDSYDSGDWFNVVDFSKQTNNWNVGLPREDKDGKNWTVISDIVSNDLINVTPNDIQNASEHFAEMLRVRSNSPLFHLSDKTQVMNRVDFHNTGSQQIPGVIVMSIDDGILAGSDLDENFQALVVIINASSQALVDFTINNASDFELHPLLIDGIEDDAITATSAFSTSGFSVPARTSAVFVKNQTSSQGDGLAVIAKTVTQTELTAKTFIRGSLYGEDWVGDEGNQLALISTGLYGVTLSLEAGDFEFKVASADLSTHNWGFSGSISEGESISLEANSNDNIQLNISEAGDYKFTLDISNFSQPKLILSKLNGACTELPDDASEGVLGATQLFVRGDHSNWAASNEYRFKHKGNNVYQALFEQDGVMQFKFSDDSESWDIQYFISEGGALISLVPDVEYSVFSGNAGTDNNQANLAAGRWSFMLALNSPLQTGENVGTLIVQECSL
jgi:pullulanase-type alpha-1,6-glucosidase